MAHIRKRVSSRGPRYDVRWRIGDTQRQRTFSRAGDAEAFRRQVESEELHAVGVDPQPGQVKLGDYANQWLAARRKPDGSPLAPRTLELYRSILDRFVLPALDGRELGRLCTPEIRAWHTQIADTFSPMQAAKAYRLLRVILNTAIEDDRISQNPCKIRGAGVERSPERPFVDAEIVLRLAAGIEERYGALVLLAGFGGLRLGELLGLRRDDIDLARAQVRIERQTVELKGGERITTAPKTHAGRRVVALPAAVSAALGEHLRRYVRPEPDAPVFTGPLSEGLRRATLYKAWHQALDGAGVTGIHLHDLRHAAGTLATQQGASLREVMARLGHASPAAAHRYQHAAERRDSVIAAALDAVLAEVRALEGAPTFDLLGDGLLIEASTRLSGDARGDGSLRIPPTPTGVGTRIPP